MNSEKLANLEDRLLLAFFGILSLLFVLYPVIEDYPSEAATFPQATGAVVIACVLLSTFSQYLPQSVQTIFTEEASLIDTDINETVGNSSENVESDDGLAYFLELAHENQNAITLLVLAIGYFTFGYLIGLLYMTPIFVFIYTEFTDVPRRNGAAIAIVSTAIVFGFIEFLNVPFDEGELLSGGGLL